MKLQQERAELLNWLTNIPGDSIERLRQINQAATTSGHIVMALAMGLYDRQIARLNRMIVSLMLARMDAERRGDSTQCDQINETLNNLHFAIDTATATVRSKAVTHEACRSANFKLRGDTAQPG